MPGLRSRALRPPHLHTHTYTTTSPFFRLPSTATTTTTPLVHIPAVRGRISAAVPDGWLRPSWKNLRSLSLYFCLRALRTRSLPLPIYPSLTCMRAISFSFFFSRALLSRLQRFRTCWSCRSRRRCILDLGLILTISITFRLCFAPHPSHAVFFLVLMLIGF